MIATIRIHTVYVLSNRNFKKYAGELVLFSFTAQNYTKLRSIVYAETDFQPKKKIKNIHVHNILI